MCIVILKWCVVIFFKKVKWLYITTTPLYTPSNNTYMVPRNLEDHDKQSNVIYVKCKPCPNIIK